MSHQLFSVKQTTACQARTVCHEVTTVIKTLSQYSLTTDNEDLNIIETFVVTMYHKNNHEDNVDEARLDLFARKQRPYNAIPPTSTSLCQHVKDLPSRQDASGASQQCVICNFKVLPTGNGNRMVESGKLFALHCH